MASNAAAGLQGESFLATFLHLLAEPFVFLTTKLAELLHAILTALEAPFVFVASKIAELPLYWKNLVEWLDRVFPPEARRQCVRFSVSALAALLLAALLLYLCFVLSRMTCFVASMSFTCLGDLCRLIWLSLRTVLSWLLPCMRSTAVVTMRAPGVAGLRISRAAFEAAPRAYFGAVRAGASLARFAAP